MLVKLAFLLVFGFAFEKVYADEPESVVGGTDADIGEFPYQVSLRSDSYHICGGSIVSDRHIITAAHCVEDDENGPYDHLTIVTGADKLDSPLGQIHNVKSVRMHPNYTDDQAYSWVHDIAVITLTEPMQFNAYQRPIPLATFDPPLNALLTLSGWGRISSPGPVPNHLQKANVYYIPNKQCERGIPGQPIYPTHLCAIQVRGIGACRGDSGGPLVYNGYLVGIVSWLVPCARGLPDIYTRVASYSSFVADVMRE